MFDFLEDKNEQASFNALGKQLQENPDAYYAACEDACKKASAAPLANALEQTEAQVSEQLERIARHARRCVDGFPLPRGVFVEAEDRSRAYAYFLDALPTIHRQTQALERATTAFLQFNRLADAQKKNALVAENRLYAAELTLKDDQSRALPYVSLHEGLRKERAHARQLSERAAKLVELLLGFCKKTVTSFFVRAEQVGDLSHQGRAIDPKGAANLLDRLGREADLLTDEILLTKRRSIDRP